MLLKKNRYPQILIVLYTTLFTWSAIRPKDYFVWLLEMAGVIFIFTIYVYFHKKIKFSSTISTWVFIAASLITVGAHYSFPNVPVFENIKGLFGFERNNFDKLGHIVQGILPVLISWEILTKKKIIQDVFWINFFSFCVAITISGLYEIVEWLFIIVFGNNSYTFDVLGTQGYIWDAQSDILCAVVGAIFTLLIGQKHLLLIYKNSTLN